MFQEERERIEVGVAAASRAVAVFGFWVYFAIVVGSTIFVLWPPGVEGWAGYLATASRAHALRHGDPHPLLDVQRSTMLIWALLAAAWSVAGVLGVGLLVRWRRLFGVPHHWGS